MNKRHKGLEDNIRVLMHEVEPVAKDVRAIVPSAPKKPG